MQRDEETNQWSKIKEDRIYHSTEITSLMSLSNEILMTYSHQDQVVKVWKLGEEVCDCFKEFKLKNKVTSIKYDSASKSIAIFDEKCNIGLLQYDFE